MSKYFAICSNFINVIPCQPLTSCDSNSQSNQMTQIFNVVVNIEASIYIHSFLQYGCSHRFYVKERKKLEAKKSFAKLIMKPQISDLKSHTSGSSGEADESLFEYLHAEIMNYVVSKNVPMNKDGEENLTRLEHMGFYVGYRIIERITREWPRFKEELDMIKFICTDFWPPLFQKPIDNLKTNHQGIYVLQDNEFRLLKRLGNNDSKQYLCESPRLIAFTCGLLRGSLANLGIVSIVKAEMTSLPSCKFHVEVQRV